MKMDEQLIYQQLRSGDEKVLKYFYQYHLAGFMSYAQNRFSLLTAPEYEDAYVKAVTDLYLRIRSDRFAYSPSQNDTGAEGSEKLKSYVYKVATNQLLNNIDKKKVQMNHERKVSIFLDDQRQSSLSNMERADRAKLIQAALAKLPETERNIIILYVYQGIDMETIADKLGLKNRHVVKSIKVRAINRLRNVLNRDEI